MTDTTKERPLVNTGLKALAELEEAIKNWEKVDKFNTSLVAKEGVKNMRSMCKLVEEWMYATEEELEKNFDKWQDEMELRCNAMIGSMTLMAEELKRKK